MSTLKIWNKDTQEYVSVSGGGSGTGTTSDVDLSAYAKKTDIPTTLPASDVKAWAKADTKPTYTASEVGALPDTTVIPSLDGYAKTSDIQAWVNQQGFKTTDNDTKYSQGNGINISSDNQISVDIDTITQSVIDALPLADSQEVF